MKTVLLGAPGSGKGTQSIILSRRYNVPQISTGDLLRKAIKSGYELNEKAKTAIDAGAFVSDDIVIGLIHKRLSNDDTKNGYIIDGFPRNIIQAKSLDLMLEKLNKNLEGVILFDIDYKELIQRLTGRRTCNNCGAIYNIHSSIPLITKPLLPSRDDKLNAKDMFKSKLVLLTKAFPLISSMALSKSKR